MGSDYPPILLGFNLCEYLTNIAKYLVGIGLSIGTTAWMPLCSPIWFLTSLFVANLLFYVSKRLNNTFLIWGILLAAFTLSNLKISLPWNIGSSLYGTWFMWWGDVLKRKANIATTGILRSALLLSLFMIVTCGLTFVNMDGNEYGNRFYFLIEASAFCTVIVLFCKKYYHSKTAINAFCNVVAGNSIAIFGYNYSINRVVSVMLQRFPQYDIWYIRYAFCLVLMTLFIYGINRIKLNKYLV